MLNRHFVFRSYCRFNKKVVLVRTLFWHSTRLLPILYVVNFVFLRKIYVLAVWRIVSLFKFGRRKIHRNCDISLSHFFTFNTFYKYQT